MEISAMNVQSQVQTALLAKTLDSSAATTLQLLATLDQTQQAVQQSMTNLASGRVDVTV